MNEISLDECIEICTLLMEGRSIRETARITGKSKNTIKRYKRIFEEQGEKFRCKCGLLSSHQGWCSHRYNNSIARQSFIEDWTSDRPRKIRPFKYRDKEILSYPYLQKEKNTYESDDHKLLIQVNDMIPKKVPIDIRGDLCQELILDVLLKKIKINDIESVMDEYVKRIRATMSNKWQHASLDGAVKGTDDLKYSDILGYDHDYDSCFEG
jgi:hypothetical protein